MDETKKPNPGSDDAIDAGCTCPVLDNGHGKGHLGEKVRAIVNGVVPLQAAAAFLLLASENRYRKT
jgi:hypothetical protein